MIFYRFSLIIYRVTISCIVSLGLLVWKIYRFTINSYRFTISRIGRVSYRVNTALRMNFKFVTEL